MRKPVQIIYVLMYFCQEYQDFLLRNMVKETHPYIRVMFYILQTIYSQKYSSLKEVDILFNVIVINKLYASLTFPLITFI